MAAEGGLAHALRPDQDKRVVSLAARLHDTGHHLNQKLAPDSPRAKSIFGPGMANQPRVQTGLAIVHKPVQRISDRVTLAMPGYGQNRVGHRFLANGLKPQTFKPRASQNKGV